MDPNVNFSKAKMYFYGHTIDQHGLHHNDDKVEAFTKARQLRNVSYIEFQRYCELLPQISAKYCKCPVSSS